MSSPGSEVDPEACAVVVRGLGHRYGERVALDGLDLAIGIGEIFGILGPNGSGKTTLFRLLSTLIAPTRGSAAIFGQDLVRDAARIRTLLGIAFQSPSVDGKLTCLENLRYRGHLQGLRGPALARRSDELLDRFDLRDRRDERLEHLSGGLRRRVELAMAVLHAPRLLLLDEPATGLDPGARRAFRGLLEQLRREDRVTVAVTTHDIEEADRCDRVTILDRGRRVALGTPEELRASIGGDVLDVSARDPAALADSIRARFDVEAMVADGTVRIRRSEAHRFVAELVDAFPEEVHSVRVGKPTLADVFLQRTGRAFHADEADDAGGEGRR
jgi:ABC-2 type transport system ATP-binding protein